MLTLHIRKLLVPLTLLCLLLNATGCRNASVPAPTSTPIPLTNTPIPPTATPIPTATNTPFVPKATLKIAVHVPMTGNIGMYGTDIFHASELAVAQLSNPLELMGYDVELVSYDDKDDLDAGVSNAKEIVADAAILCGVGHFTSRITIQATEVYHRAGLAFISPSATNPTVTDRGYLEINRVIGRDDVQGAVGARFTQERGYKAVYIISNSSPYGQKNSDYFKREADKLGVIVVGNLTTDSPGNFEGTIKRILEAQTDLVYFAGFADQAGTFFSEARGMGYTGTFLGTDGVSSPDVINFAGPFLIDGGGMYYTTVGGDLNSLPNAAQFAKDYQTRFSAEPQMYAPYAYDAAGICMKAIEEASKAKGGELPTRAEVAKAIRALVDYKGITGTYNFNENGDPTNARYQVYQATTIDPDKWGANPVVASYDIAPLSK